MSKLELVRQYYAYNEWTNDRLMDIAKGLDAGQLAGPSGTSFQSITGNMAHLAAAQINWLERWQTGANSEHTVTLGERMKTLADVRSALDSSHSDLRAYLDSLTDAKLDAALRYKDRSGNIDERPLWQLMLHVANHGTFHRGEVAMVLTALGHSPGEIDFMRWVEAGEPG